MDPDVGVPLFMGFVVGAAAAAIALALICWRGGRFDPLLSFLIALASVAAFVWLYSPSSWVWASVGGLVGAFVCILVVMVRGKLC